MPWLLVVAGVLGCVLAQPLQTAQDTPKLTLGQEQYRLVTKDYIAARAALVNKLQSAQSLAEKEKIQDQMIDLAAQFSPRFLKIADEHPKDPGAEDALALVCSSLLANDRSGEPGAKAFGRLVESFPQSKRIPQFVIATRAASTTAVESPLRRLFASHPDKEVRGQACLSLAENLRLRHEHAVRDRDAAAAAALADQARAALRLGQTNLATTKAGREFDNALYALEKLTVGKTPPPFEGEDVLSAKPLRLEDAQGKVVVLCFWGNWSSPSRAMLPQFRELVKRMEGKPFALLGVNSDKDREATKAVLAKDRVTFPNFWNGGGPGGPIAALYKVQIWPTTYVLDGRGVIRYRNVRGSALDAALESLLKEAGAK